jgi:hypothetical protein
MYEVTNQKQLDELLKHDALDLNKFGINRFVDKRVMLNGSFFEIDCSSRLIKSLPKIDFIGGAQTVVKFVHAEEGYSQAFDGTDLRKVSVFNVGSNFTFNNVFVTSDTYLEIVFTDREDLESWDKVRFDTANIGVYILLEEVEKFKEFLDSYDVEGVLQVGDHVVVDRGIYTHHGVYIGDNTLIHYSGEPGVTGKITEIKLEDFAKGDTFWVYEYDECLPTTEIIAKAKSRLGEEKYAVATNNCEHFANWCCTDESWSNQAEVGSLGIVFGGIVGGVIGYGMASLANDGGARKYKLK